MILATVLLAQALGCCIPETGNPYPPAPVAFGTGNHGCAVGATFILAACPGTGPTPTPTAPAATPTPTSTTTVAATEVPLTMATSNFFYAPGCVVLPPSETSAPYACLPTVGDEIRLYTSADRTTWTDRGVVLPAACGTWEDTGLEHAGSATCSGVSNMTVAWSRTTSRWIGCYIAGQLPNGASSGGIGLAWASSLAGPWTRFAGNPILLESGGFASDPVLLRLGQSLGRSQFVPYTSLWLYFTGADDKLYRLPIDDATGVVAGTPQPLAGLTGYVPIASDWDGCWLARGVGWTDFAGFTSMEVWKGSDCMTNPGTLVGTIVASQLIRASANAVRSLSLGNRPPYPLPLRLRRLPSAAVGVKATALGSGSAPAGIIDIGVIERSADGMILGGPTLLVAAWDSWASVTPPRALRFGQPLSMQMPTALRWGQNIMFAPAPTPTPSH